MRLPWNSELTFIFIWATLYFGILKKFCISLLTNGISALSWKPIKTREYRKLLMWRPGLVVTVFQPWNHVWPQGHHLWKSVLVTLLLLLCDNSSMNLFMGVRKKKSTLQVEFGFVSQNNKFYNGDLNFKIVLHGIVSEFEAMIMRDQNEATIVAGKSRRRIKGKTFSYDVCVLYRIYLNSF